MTKSTITREPITHDLKIYPEFFSAVCTGVKRAELRKNDRDYRVGDTLHLMETPRGSCHQTGEFINVIITHIADVGEWMPGYVLLSVELQERRKAESEPVFTLEVSQADYKGQKLGNHFGFITLDAARELKEGNYQLYTAQPAPVVPDGYVMVPKEMTDEIGEAIAMQANCCGGIALDIYDAMLAAAPQSPGGDHATVPG
ncbi:TPA: DUF3850 domain-containing protein, partial [Klebsiella quasipneumoniae subsp. similipneumoniae]|nr:DUF3850 domain-containing protein [Klebsiella quasipneumoniae subsp. similipneumoniae]